MRQLGKCKQQVTLDLEVALSISSLMVTQVPLWQFQENIALKIIIRS